ncbi:MAG: hypothetical protein ACI4WS_09045 [Oscillospiraceae bacterium]
MWEIIIQHRTTEDNTAYTAYGVRNGSFCIADITTDPADIAAFTQLLNRFEVSPVNALDITEDFLSGGFPEFSSAHLAVTA